MLSLSHRSYVVLDSAAELDRPAKTLSLASKKESKHLEIDLQQGNLSIEDTSIPSGESEEGEAIWKGGTHLEKGDHLESYATV